MAEANGYRQTLGLLELRPSRLREEAQINETLASLYRLLLQLFLQDCSSRSRDRYTRKYHVRSEQVSFRCILTANARSVRTKFSKEIPFEAFDGPPLNRSVEKKDHEG